MAHNLRYCEICHDEKDMVVVGSVQQGMKLPAHISASQESVKGVAVLSWLSSLWLFPMLSLELQLILWGHSHQSASSFLSQPSLEMPSQTEPRKCLRMV